MTASASIRKNPAPHPAYLGRFAEYYRRCGIPCLLANGTLWVLYNRTVVPVGPIAEDHTIPVADARAVLAQFRGAVLLYCTDGFDRLHSTAAWYALVHRQPTDLKWLRSKARYKIRHGLGNCNVRRVDAEFIACRGYETHIAAYARYEKAQRRRMAALSEDEFRRRIMITADFSDIIDYWAVLCDDHVVGFTQTYLFGSDEAFFYVTELNPEYFKLHISYALIYTRNEFYLRERGLAYVNDGFRSVLHRTQFQELLVHEFGFEHATLGLHIVYKPWVSMMMSLPCSVRRLGGRLNQRFAALNEMHKAATTRS